MTLAMVAADPTSNDAGTAAAVPGPGHGAGAYGLWLALLAAGGFAVPALGSAWLHLPRAWYLLPYVVIVAAVTAAYVRWDAVPVRAGLRRRWAWGVLGALIAGALAAAGAVQGASAPGPAGLQRVLDLLWLGVAYGTADALLLNVLPVWIVWRLLRAREPDAGWGRRFGAAAVAVVASVAVTAAYHLGYVEFRSAALAGPLIGNAIITAAYVVTGNAIAPLGAHVTLHVATVLYALDTAPTLPPHY